MHAGRFWLGVQDGEETGWIRTCLVLWVQVDSMESFVYENLFYFKIYFHKRQFTRGCNLSLFVLCCKHNPIQETDLEEMLTDKDQWSWWGKLGCWSFLHPLGLMSASRWLWSIYWAEKLILGYGLYIGDSNGIVHRAHRCVFGLWVYSRPESVPTCSVQNVR